MDESKHPRLRLVVSNRADPANGGPKAGHREPEPCSQKAKYLRAIIPLSDDLIGKLRTHASDMMALMKDHPPEACFWMARRLDNGPKEQELVDAIRSLAPSDVRGLRAELGKIKIFSVFASVREAAERKLAEAEDTI